MPKAASKKQFRFMQAVLHGYTGHARGVPPKSVAAKYVSDKEAPESKNNDKGGTWSKEHHSDHSKGKSRKKSKLSKAFEQYYKGQGVGIIVVDEKGDILVGKGEDGKWQTPGGHVDPGEDYDQAAIRELQEEAGIKASSLKEIGHVKINGNDSKVFHCDSYSGSPKDSQELKQLKFVPLHSLLDWDLRDCCRVGLEMFASSHLNKSSKLKDMLAIEVLNKNTLKGPGGRQLVLDVSHGEAIRLVGNGCLRMLKQVTDDMKDEDFKDINIDTHTISIRKHINDMYSGRISDGHKVIHQFTNKSLSQLCADVMSVFEWYSDEDDKVFDILDQDNLPDDAIAGGLQALSDNYKKHNLANIYTEMENIRAEIRNGVAVDLQQIESKIMSLFDKLEDTMHNIADKHNMLNSSAGKEIEMLEDKLRELQLKIDDLSNKPSKVEAFQTKPIDPQKVYSNHYMYLPKPHIEVCADGKISISFEKGWTDMEKSNFLNDMKARIIKKSK
jgi:8-oxo-dGTP pyrophosphatase MutT (NUDIX family)